MVTFPSSNSSKIMRAAIVAQKIFHKFIYILTSFFQVFFFMSSLKFILGKKKGRGKKRVKRVRRT